MRCPQCRGTVISLLYSLKMAAISFNDFSKVMCTHVHTHIHTGGGRRGRGGQRRGERDRGKGEGLTVVCEPTSVNQSGRSSGRNTRERRNTQGKLTLDKREHITIAKTKIKSTTTRWPFFILWSLLKNQVQTA